MSNKTAIVTGASSGVGRATAHALAAAGYDVACLARRADALQSTVAKDPARLHAYPCDITDRTAVDATVNSILTRFARVDVLINAAGTNLPDRTLASMTDEKFKAVFDVNLSGALYAIQAVLPAMRSQQGGTIVNINSIAGQNASLLSGAAYVMSKFALAGLTQTVNLEEGKHHVRATSIFPGDIHTELLEKRPVIPDAAARARMMQPEDIAACVMLAVNLPPRAVVEELRIVPRG
ncbi:MAG: SDR family oxidoreductase [Phycisphaerae bacterium]